MADTQDNRPGEEEDEEEEIDDAVCPDLVDVFDTDLHVAELQDDKRCRPLRDRHQSIDAGTSTTIGR